MRNCGTISKCRKVFTFNEDKLNCITPFALSNQLRYYNNSDARNTADSGLLETKLFPDGKGAFAKAYNPRDVENSWYKWWENQGYFSPNSGATGTPFSMVLPPPNVTGTLHLGHALTCTIQDVLARWHRMRGCPVLWVPGMDHAGIATQVVIEKKLWQEQKMTRHDVGRDKFITEVWKWKEEKGSIINKQLRRLGLSLDWTKEMFTMDPVQTAAVTEAFIRLFDADLIYRSSALVNWSCVLQSAISDVEVDFRQVAGPTAIKVPGYSEPVDFGVLTDFAYKLCDRDDEIVVSTTRVETMLGDTAVAVHPLDNRYKFFLGEHVWHPFRKEKIPIICDDFVDQYLGTGAVKITPAHDTVDFEVGRRHNLEMMSVIGENGQMNELCGEFSHMKRFDARRSITEKLNSLGLLRGKKGHTMQVPFCSRSGDVVELLLKPQWFVNSKEMARRALLAVHSGELKINPSFFEKTWYTWLHETRDWCVSRQLWWGHQIPAYECSSKGSLYRESIWVAAHSLEEAKEKAARKLNVEVCDISSTQQDMDVLDTWFSSALFPFSAMGWPGKVDRYYPLSLMETGHDILFFWVARMVMLGTQLTGQLPFKNILLHGIICDSEGRKMSKSLGNVVYPEDIISGLSLQNLNLQAQKSFEAGLLSKSELEKTLEGQKKMFPKGIAECGADALRFTLCTVNIKYHFINFDVQQCHANKLFCNKIWQACKYTILCTDKVPNAVNFDLVGSRSVLSKLDRWILSRLAHMVEEVHKGLTEGDLHVATQALRTFLYNEICDFYLETTKPVLKEPDTQAAVASSCTLLHCLYTALHALSPFMPFITEELYHHLPRHRDHHLSESIMVAPFPLPAQWEHWKDINTEKEINSVISVISAIRRLKAKYNISKDKTEVHIVTPSVTEIALYNEHLAAIELLAGCKNIIFSSQDSTSLKDMSVFEAVGPESFVHLIMKGVFDLSDEKETSVKEEKLLKELSKLTKIINGDRYKISAPQTVQEANSLKIENLENELKQLREFRKLLRRNLYVDA